MPMLRGAIELATTELIQGWIYSDAGPVRDLVIVALSGQDCLGTGRVDVFRPDLADAGVGDGNCGFSFPITVRPDALDSVVVKLDGSDAVLLQADARVGNSGTKPIEMKRSTVLWHLARLKWALKRGRISQTDFDYLRTLWPAGVYERGLIRRRAADDGVIIDSWREVARGLFEAYLGLDAELTTQEIQSPAEFKQALDRTRRSTETVVVVALHCRGQSTLRVLEGSHVMDGANGDENSPIHVNPAEYFLSSETLVMLDCRVKADLIWMDEVSVEMGFAKILQPV
jgi:hypothetical protein